MTTSSIEQGFNVCSKDIQYILYKENETIILFSTIVSNIPCRASLVFKLFRCPRSYLILYSYKIRYILPPGVSVDVVAIWNHSIAADAQ